LSDQDTHDKAVRMAAEDPVAAARRRAEAGIQPRIVGLGGPDNRKVGPHTLARRRPRLPCESLIRALIIRNLELDATRVSCPLERFGVRTYFSDDLSESGLTFRMRCGRGPRWHRRAGYVGPSLPVILVLVGWSVTSPLPLGGNDSAVAQRSSPTTYSTPCCAPAGSNRRATPHRGSASTTRAVDLSVPDKRDPPPWFRRTAVRSVARRAGRRVRPRWTYEENACVSEGGCWPPRSVRH